MHVRSEPILSLRNVSKSFFGKTLRILDNISFALASGETTAIIGPSGCGKTTLLGLAAGLDRPTSGSVMLCGKEVSQCSEDQLAALRNHSVGFVFQTFQLLPTLTALENVLLPLEIAGERRASPQAKELLDRVGLSARLHHYPQQLSGGEQQRVALARAFINSPQVLFADEPTGNLDETTSQMVIDLMFDLHQQHQSSMLIVTHNQELAARTNRILELHQGQLYEKTLL